MHQDIPEEKESMTTDSSPFKIDMEMRVIHTEGITRRKTTSNSKKTKKSVEEHTNDAISEAETAHKRKPREILRIIRGFANASSVSRMTANLDVVNDRQAKKLAKQIFLALSNSVYGEVLMVDFKPYFFTQEF